MTEQLAKSQAAFEANLLALYPKWDARIVFAKRPDGEYAALSTHVGWLSWQPAVAAGRKQALEDVAEGFIKQKAWVRDYAFAVVEHAAKEGVTK